MNEDDITGSCTGTCADMPTKYDFNGCKKLSGCTFSSGGWLRGFVDCDYCKCECEQDFEKDAVVTTGFVSTDEDELYGTCTGTCDKSGLVRTNFKGWQVRTYCPYV
ncbi:hypothetical protein CYMTET_30621 [Cymbomonas tetramitiformis]|uniref:Uncharacterized protein n=1 Tax=Cymbomonas tetramitiformis TaxID=36881 RepID=A0AAE0KU06_9CHLO|nr:hypothetical protein CYMTET_30621 [Cymbomonas tetramitiformis]